MYLDNFINISEILVDRDIINTDFVCDLPVCKGACCTLKSDFGAPVEPGEIDLINESLEIVMEYLPSAHRDEINHNGFWEKHDDDLLIRSVNKRACVFVYYDGDIAKCSFERAHIDGKISFIKPISCHLFPIRCNSFGGRILRFERYRECEPALNKGLQSGIKIFEFCSESLKRLLGNDWCKKIAETAEREKC